MKKTCADATMRIALAPSPATPDAPQTTTLHLAAAGGAERAIDKPAEMKDYTAVGLGCAAAADGKPYFVVEYGELPQGCSFCEWFYLYDGTGKQLTRSDPPIREDASLPPAQQQSPNNDEYEAMLKTLGLDHPEIEVLP